MVAWNFPNFLNKVTATENLKIDLNDCFGRNLAMRFLGDKRPQNEIF